MLGNDGGGAVSIDARRRAGRAQDFPTAQFYHVVTTSTCRFTSAARSRTTRTLCVPSDTESGGRGGGRRRRPAVAPYDAGGGEPGYIAPDPKDPDVFFAGANNGSFLTR